MLCSVDHRQPFNYRVDLRVARDFRVGRAVVELLAEGFNVFNRKNFNGFNSTRYDAQATTGRLGEQQGRVVFEDSPFEFDEGR